ncbi:DUF397 domain-containing protein [Streptomyces angustmyceticus]|uniref:DUF397 domain-containing protein n=1 Tax=Streptomyces angustmyceticus TaxID=285578 RepID=UPI003D8FB2F7
MNTLNLRSQPTWRKSSYSSGAGNCVEVASLGPDAWAVRDSKNPAQAPLRFSSTAFAAFLRRLTSST